MSRKILIVDDVATNRIVYKVKLGAACYEPLMAADGESCLRLARENKPDLILLDLILPDMDGTEVLAKLRADPATASIPVVVYSASCDPEQRMRALQAGADDFLSKTTDDQTLLARMRNLLRGREAIAGLDTGDQPLHSFGFAEEPPTFSRPGTIALVTLRPETALRWRRDLALHIPDTLIMMSREQALADQPNAAQPDVFVIEAEKGDQLSSLRLISELRSRNTTHHASICIVQAEAGSSDTAIAFDLGANDMVVSGVDPRELGLRLQRLTHRKREGDHMRASVRDGLRLALIDPLTGLYNRRFALNHLTAIAQHARVDKQPFAVMVVDLDRFKEVNDRFGHPAGDAVLIEVAHRMAACMRGNDLLARIGGEEFLIALPNADLQMARPIAERLCRSIEAEPFEINRIDPLHLTASIGLAISDPSGSWQLEHVTDLIERADKALLHAKSCGRNRVTIGLSAA
jgi:two-component system cell cycle response regulator